MGEVKEKVTCQYCGKEVSKAGIANHEKACPKNPLNIVEEVPVAPVTTTPDMEEEVLVTPSVTDVPQEGTVVTIVTETAKKEKLVEVKMKESIECYIGDRYYRLKKGEVTEVSPEVKERLKSADLLEAL